jgi:hypothetical protein
VQVSAIGAGSGLSRRLKSGRPSAISLRTAFQLSFLRNRRDLCLAEAESAAKRPNSPWVARGFPGKLAKRTPVMYETNLMSIGVRTGYYLYLVQRVAMRFPCWPGGGGGDGREHGMGLCRGHLRRGWEGTSVNLTYTPA